MIQNLLTNVIEGKKKIFKILSLFIIKIRILSKINEFSNTIFFYERKEPSQHKISQNYV